MTYAVIVRWVAKAGEEADAERCLRGLIEPHAKSRGNLAYQPHRDPEETRVFHIYERYVDEAAALAHLETPVRTLGFGDAIPRLEDRQRVACVPIESRRTSRGAAKALGVSPIPQSVSAVPKPFERPAHPRPMRKGRPQRLIRHLAAGNLLASQEDLGHPHRATVRPQHLLGERGRRNWPTSKIRCWRRRYHRSFSPNPRAQLAEIMDLECCSTVRECAV